MKTLLIVDDEPGIRQGYIDFFEDRLWTVIEAESGEVALEKLSDETADIAIVDIRMEGMDGIAFIKKAQLSHPMLKFIISTGTSDYEYPKDFFNSDNISDNIILKPIADMGVFEVEIQKLLKRDSKND